VQYGAKQPLGEQLGAIEAYLGIACLDDGQCAIAEERVGVELRARGELRLAAAHLSSAARRAPTAARWVEVARVARDTGDVAMLDGALDEVTRLGATVPDDLRDAAEQLRRSKLTPDD
jgi:hypothetical protein